MVTLCAECDSAIRTKRIPKFSGSNYANTTLCQEYPSALMSLTYVEECVIALAHPIGAVLKLTGRGRSSGIEYRGSRGHFITFKQDPCQLLTILPSSLLDLYKHVTISWTGKSKPTPENLMAFCKIKEKRVLRALIWLTENNPLYSNVKVNCELIQSWEKRSVPQVLLDAAVITDDDSRLDQREDYATDLEDGNYENDLDALYEKVDAGSLVHICPMNQDKTRANKSHLLQNLRN
jgi:hypothetical protein